MHAWRKITLDPLVLDIVEHCHLDLDVSNISPLFSEEVEYVFKAEERVIIDQEIAKLLDLKVITLTQRQFGQVISPIFLREKKNGEFRMIINLEKLNTHIAYKHFKMENFEQAVRLINKGDFMASVDLRHAYYSIKIAEEQQKFLCFKWRGKIYHFTCLANGICDGPRLFTKLMKPVFATLRELGYTITSYIDDTLICSSSLAGCYDCIRNTVLLLQNLGFCINEEKSILVPTNRIEYLGNVIDSVNMTVSLPERRIEKIRHSCTRLLQKRREKIREVARVIGLLVAAIPALELGKLYYRRLETAKVAALRYNGGNFDKWMPVTEDMKTDLRWWVNQVIVQDRKIFRKSPDIELYTDASDLGWGGCLNSQTTGGRWCREEIQLHINARELKAIFLTLKSFAQEVRGKHVKVFCDNTTAITYVNEMGGTKSLVCNEVCIEIWEWCVDRGVWITCSHIPGKDNIRADKASRTFNDRHEWRLNENIFRDICKIFGVPNIDLFASRLNKQVTRFCSWKPDPEAEFFDAFSISWARFDLVYIFPPFSLISRCLQKLRAEQATGWLVVPLWPSQPWMGALLQMLVKEPLLITKTKNVLTQPLSTEDHPIMRHTKLMACLLSGKTCENEAFRQRVLKSSWPPGSQGPRNSTVRMSTDGHNFVIGGKLIPLIPL